MFRTVIETTYVSWGGRLQFSPEAMKMEAAITVPGGTVSRTAIDRIAPVEGGDLLLVVDVDNAAKCEQPPDRSAEIVGVGC